MFNVYILRSISDNKRYVGFTDNLERRLYEHNSGKVKSTRNRKPFELIYSELFENKSDAMAREKFFKTHPGRTYSRLNWKVEQQEGMQPGESDLI